MCLNPLCLFGFFGDEVFFCRSDDDHCKNMFIMKKYNISGEVADDLHYITDTSPNYIYKITEKETGKCYIGKTKNAPFFRWWDHLTKNFTKFGKHLRETKLSDWNFEVLEELQSSFTAKNLFKIESDYIIRFDSINNGFNSLISNKQSNET